MNTSGTSTGEIVDREAINAELLEQQEMILETLNGRFEDATLLVGRILGDRRGATGVRAVSVSVERIEMLLTDNEGTHPVTVSFTAPPQHADELFRAFFALVVTARERSGEAGTTSVEQVIATAGGYRTFFTSVVAVEEVNANLRQITFGGGDLTTFAPVGPDTFLYLLLPPPGHTELSIDESFSWEAVREMDPELRPVGAYYTLRRWRPDVAEIDVLMVLHGDVGAASAWAARATRGDPVALWGPRTAWAPPAETDQFLLVADETGLPAVAAILETLGANQSVMVVAEVADVDSRQELPDASGTDITWIYRAGVEAGRTTGLIDAVRALPAPSGNLYVWGGAESRAMTAVRRHVRDQWGLAQEQVSLVGYWRHRAHAEDPPGDE